MAYVGTIALEKVARELGAIFLSAPQGSIGGINPSNLPDMTTKDILENLPAEWTPTTNNGFTHVRDANGIIRMRIDPPDAVTNYHHIHLYDINKNPLDIHFNIVSPKLPAAHIPIRP